YDNAIGEYRRTLQLDSSFVPVHWWLGLAYAKKEMFEEAIAEAKKAAELTPGAPWGDMYLGYLYAVSGRKNEALQALQRLEQRSGQQYATRYLMAFVYLGLGDKDRAVQLYQASLQDRSENQMLLKAFPDFDPLRSDPR